MLELDAPIAYDDPQLEERLAQSLGAINSGTGRVIDDMYAVGDFKLADVNFAGL